MIVERSWHKYKKFSRSRKYFKGWFLLGIIPLYIKSTDWMEY